MEKSSETEIVWVNDLPPNAFKKKKVKGLKNDRKCRKNAKYKQWINDGETKELF